MSRSRRTRNDDRAYFRRLSKDTSRRARGWRKRDERIVQEAERVFRADRAAGPLPSPPVRQDEELV